MAKPFPSIMISSLATMALGGCMVGEDVALSSTAGTTFEEFLAATYQEPWAGGHFIVDGDTPIKDAKQLYEFWETQISGALIINQNGTTDDRWSDSQKRALTYCISDGFGANKARVVAAVAAATDQGWETMADVDFQYLPAHDASCTAGNAGVVFDVRPVSGQPYLARAFFPANTRASREVLIDASAFGNVGWPLANIVGHELGHVLGFRHEHTRPEAGTCFEDNRWRPLTGYDSASIMHYPQCNGSSSDLDWTAMDAQGAAAVYGAPGGTTPPPPAPGTARTDSRTGTLAQGEVATLAPYAVAAGTTFTVTMTGTGDPDLYVRWGAAPSTSTFTCRPYIDGADEHCALTVPVGQTTAHVLVHGYAAASYQLAIAWTAP